MKYLKHITPLFAICLLSAPAWADLGYHGAGYYAGAAEWQRLSGHYAGQGGEFTLFDSTSTSANYQTPFSLSNGAYANSTKNLGGYANSFQTFCIEPTEKIAEPMHVWVSEANKDGSPGSHAWKGGEADGNNLDSKTAWLYTQFATGNLLYTYDNADKISVNGTSLTRAQSAGALQRLIWATETGLGADFTATYEGISLNAAQRALIDIWNEQFELSGWTGIGHVRVLQTYTGTAAGGTGLKQDLLYLAVPAPGAALLAFMGLGLVGWVKRRIA